MANPFDDEDGVFHVLRNQTGEFSLWPAFVPTPIGWHTVVDSVDHATAVEFVAREWTTLTPAHRAGTQDLQELAR